MFPFFTQNILVFTIKLYSIYTISIIETSLWKYGLGFGLLAIILGVWIYRWVKFKREEEIYFNQLITSNVLHLPLKPLLSKQSEEESMDWEEKEDGRENINTAYSLQKFTLTDHALNNVVFTIMKNRYRTLCFIEEVGSSLQHHVVDYHGELRLNVDLYQRHTSQIATTMLRGAGYYRGGLPEVGREFDNLMSTNVTFKEKVIKLLQTMANCKKALLAIDRSHLDCLDRASLDRLARSLGHFESTKRYWTRSVAKRQRELDALSQDCNYIMQALEEVLRLNGQVSNFRNSF